MTDFFKKTLGGKSITVYPCFIADRPIIYLNTFSNEGAQVYQKLTENGCSDFTLVTIGGLNWDHDMSPWEIPPITPNDTPCTGGADEYLELLLNEIIPSVEKELHGVSWRGMRGIRWRAYSRSGCCTEPTFFRARQVCRGRCGFLVSRNLYSRTS